MANTYFQFKQFIIHQDRCAMKVTTDGCLFGAWVAERERSLKSKVRDQQSEPDSYRVKSEKETPVTILDIGTGTGLLSLMLAQSNPNSLIDAIEIDKDAFEQATGNIDASSWASQLTTHHGNVKEFSFSKHYDVIISNPPFYEKELKSGSRKKNTAHHDEGLILDDLLGLTKKNLKQEGKFYMLLPYKRNEEIEAACQKNGLVVLHKTLVKQSAVHGFFRVMVTGTHADHTTKTFTADEIAIRDEKQEYTEEFKSLLKDYYLYL